MSKQLFQRLEGVNVELKANIYFDGKVVSHSVIEKNGDKKTLGLIYPGAYSFNTGAPELMLVTSGRCQVRLAGNEQWKDYAAGQEFRVPGNSSFEIRVGEGIAEYLCIFEK
jgi:purine/pyrimidine-nucleoside phosphorylase